MTQPVLAVDIGGTKIALAVVAQTGEILRELVRSTPRSDDADEVFSAVAEGLTAVVDEAELAGGLRVGIGSAGPIDTPSGTISPVNIPAWREFPVVERVRALLGETGLTSRIGLAGDGHCFALGEHWLGAGRDCDSIVGLVLSTGVGGGAVLGNKLFAGRTGNAVHLGHISVNAWGEQCVCGAYGCVEMYARGPALVAQAHRGGWDGGDDAQALTASARSGDPVALAAIDRGMRALAAGMVATAAELDVTTFVLGGGVSKAGDVIFGPLRRHIKDFAVLAYVTEMDVRPAELSNAGLLGAAALAFSLAAPEERS